MAEVRDRRSERREQTQREIVAVAWRLSDERGLAGWALRDVAEAIGIRTPSLYVYVDSKNDLYDAMFADGYRELLRRTAEADRSGPPEQVVRRAAHLFFDFCTEQPARYLLMFLRTLPGFAPSPASYELAEQTLDALTEVLRAAGAGSTAAVDTWTALFTGLASQQAANDPGGRRWARLVDDAVDMFLAAHGTSRRR